LRVILVGGLLSDCVADVAAIYGDALEALRERGYQVELIPVGGLSSSRRNAKEIAEFLSRLELQPDEKLVLIGHSKGAIDILRFLVDFPGSLEAVVAVASIAGAINGSPLADWVGETARPWLGWLPRSWCSPGDSGALDDLRRSERLEWLRSNRLPDSVRYYSVAAFTPREEAAWPLQHSHYFLSYVDPRNDGQLIFYDQIIPGATLLGYANTDHWGVALPLETKHFWLGLRPVDVPPFPRTALLEAILLYVAEELRRETQGMEAAR
jgi:pimeloyl-ACP methyl ester carboxylesterase